MVIDKLEHADRYTALGYGIRKALEYLQNTDFADIAAGKHVIDGDELFAIVQEYDTMDSVSEQMESHRKYTDVQYVASGVELVGHSLLGNQQVSKEYSEEEDFMLYTNKPDFYTQMAAGTFMIFFPTDLHMPCLRVDGAVRVKKVVVKVKINEFELPF